MKFRPLFGLSAAFILSLGLSACGNHGTRLIVQGQGLNGAAKSLPAMSAKQSTCPVPFSLIEAGLTPLIQRGQFPKVKYELSELQIHEESESTGKSFSAIARAGKSFEVEMECDAVVDGDGDDATNASFHAPVGLDLLNQVRDTQQREIKIGFKNGKLVESLTRVIQDGEGLTLDELGSIPEDRIQIGEDSFLTLKIYSLPDSALEFRMKWDGPANEAGKRVIQHSRARYTQISEF
jgi:hypothetical protein